MIGKLLQTGLGLSALVAIVACSGQSSLQATGEAPAGQAAEAAIDPRAGQGAAYVRAFCPGSTKAWLSFSRISRYPLSIKAFGDDPAAPGKARACADMTFRFRGEWALPGRGPPDPMEETRDLGPF